MRLVRETYLKVIVGREAHYLKERCYASESDGCIKTEFITKATFLKAVNENKRTEEVDINNARLNIRNAIEKVS